jgi:hypothetical protein
MLEKGKERGRAFKKCGWPTLLPGVIKGCMGAWWLRQTTPVIHRGLQG